MNSMKSFYTTVNMMENISIYNIYIELISTENNHRCYFSMDTNLFARLYRSIDNLDRQSF